MVVLRQRIVALLQQNIGFRGADAGPYAIVTRCTVVLRQRMVVLLQLNIGFRGAEAVCCFNYFNKTKVFPNVVQAGNL